MLLVALGIVLSQGCSFLEEPESYYPTREELVADNAIRRGWVPSWLPASAHAINLAYNLDTNEVWLRFELDPREVPRIQACRKDNGTGIDDARGPHRRRSWWVTDPREGWDGYACRWEQDGTTRTARLAVNAKRGIALYRNAP